MSWNPLNGQKFGPVMAGHKQWITALVWEPYHLNPSCRRCGPNSLVCFFKYETLVIAIVGCLDLPVLVKMVA